MSAMRLMAAVLLMVLVAACEGPAGPAGADGAQGPIGPEGPAGPPGPQGVTRILLTGVASATGEVVVTLPSLPNVGPTSPPAMTCYYTDNPASGVWIAANDGFWVTDTPWCALDWQTTVYQAYMQNLVPGWTAAFVIVH